MPRSAIRLRFRNDTNRDFKTFIPGNVALRLRNRTGSCLNGNLDNNGVLLCPPGRSAFIPTRGVVANGITFCKTADNRTFVQKLTKRQFYIQGSNVATIIRKINSRTYRCVAKNGTVILNRAKHGFTTNVDNNVTCILSRANSFPAHYGHRVISLRRLASPRRVHSLRRLVRHRVSCASDGLNRHVLGG